MRRRRGRCGSLDCTSGVEAYAVLNLARPSMTSMGVSPLQVTAALTEEAQLTIASRQHREEGAVPFSNAHHVFAQAIKLRPQLLAVSRRAVPCSASRLSVALASEQFATIALQNGLIACNSAFHRGIRAEHRRHMALGWLHLSNEPVGPWRWPPLADAPALWRASPVASHGLTKPVCACGHVIQASPRALTEDCHSCLAQVPRFQKLCQHDFNRRQHLQVRVRTPEKCQLLIARQPMKEPQDVCQRLANEAVPGLKCRVKAPLNRPAGSTEKRAPSFSLRRTMSSLRPCRSCPNCTALSKRSGSLRGNSTSRVASRCRVSESAWRSMSAS